MLDGVIDLMDSIGLGTYRLGAKTQSTCLMALEMGYRHLDTAALYNNERDVALAVERSLIPRERIFITSKVPLKAIRSGGIKDAARKSLNRLGKIDLLLLHAPGTDPTSAWKEMLEIKTWEGIGNVGVSNFNIQQLQQLEPDLPHWNQVEISPFLQRRELVNYCEGHDIKLIAHSPLIKGKKMACPQLLNVAQDCGCTPAQILLAWSLAKGYIVIPRSSQKQHLQENLQAKDILLPREVFLQLERLEEGYATHPQHIYSNEQLTINNEQLRG